MRTDLLSKRMFTAGCFGLPWLWICHAWYWHGKKNGTEGEEDNENALINPDDRKSFFLAVVPFRECFQNLSIFILLSGAARLVFSRRPYFAFLSRCLSSRP